MPCLPCSCSLPYAARCPCPASSPSPCLAHRPRAAGRRKTDRTPRPGRRDSLRISLWTALTIWFALRGRCEVGVCWGWRAGVAESCLGGAARGRVGSYDFRSRLVPGSLRLDRCDTDETARVASAGSCRRAAGCARSRAGIPPAVRGRNAGACHAWKRGYDRGTGPSPLKSCAGVPAVLRKAGNIPSLPRSIVEARALISGSDFDGTNVEVRPLP